MTSSLVVYISTEMDNQGKITKAHETARGINDKYWKSYALVDISAELAKQGKVTDADAVILEALETARGISDESDKSCDLVSISIEMAKQGSLKQAEEIALEIRSTAERHRCWADMANGMFELKGVIDSLSIGQCFSSDEARLIYLRKWSWAMIPNGADEVLFYTVLPQMASDPICIENLLHAHALHCTFFYQTEKKKLQRLNQTLNIQWALDIASKFSKSFDPHRLSTKLEEWIDEISDEDDRDQVRLWARQVAKGRLSEVEFTEKVAELDER
jgi:hypothetical protein